ncbi:type VI secretion system protein VasI [Tistlia consotensis]|uniref:Type VI secretion system protein VasI n=1 Tax=Tistlia consotensis USBA 355 TaxID=560819 RepID=A0A1Y6BIB7_9PROT|nr:type VI secretion system-associated protein TagO [Tistlia consotensis]SMF05206.1 type VI secretion system protein VasI [Tistlia consotensis USBA 355]SNR55121.1 type VI secretion system protein VasI [Tistlia consotensis]
MRFSLFLAVLVLLGSTAAQAASPEDCAKIADDNRRLTCFDLIFRKSSHTEKADYSKWRVTIERSKIDDTTNVFMFLDARGEIRRRFGGTGYPTLVIACRENKTGLWLTFAGHFMADNGSYGDVTFRIDSEKAFDRSLSESTDHEALGLWSGDRSIPFIKQLFGKKTLLVRATPFSESSLTMEFPITGVEDAIEPLRKACHW